MRTDAILPARPVTNTSSTLASGPTEAAVGLAPIDQVRRQVSAALFGPDASPTQVGRFQVQKLIGAGGMGVVFAAHDPQLGRTVALKLLQPMSSDERARERLLREAQAMARLQHPNVIGVHETGVHGDQVYVVMEYVEEGTLTDWLRVRPRSWQETVDMLMQAGEGLAAAHAAGLVHRDFKPANILVGGGRARISDFGLARATVMLAELERTSEDDGSLLASPLTRTGALLGTPAYMAPEQIRGEAVLASSDQFAFAIVLYEALFGHRPFLGASIGALVLAIDGGQIARPSRKLSLPSAVFAVIRRALSPGPAQRFPSMRALLDALRAARRPAWRPPLLAGLGAVALLAGLAWQSSPPTPTPTGICDGDGLAGVWDDARRDSLEASLEGATAARTIAGLDAYADAWRTQQASRCQQAIAEPQWIDICLADRRTALGDLAQVIAEAPAAMHSRAPLAVDLLPALTDCTHASKYNTLVSGATPEIRAGMWRIRLAAAEAYAPRITTHPPQLSSPSSGRQDASRVATDRRAGVEQAFVTAVAALHRIADPPPGPSVMEEMLKASHLATFHRRLAAPLPLFTAVGRDAATAGFADLAARAWAIAAELQEAGPHTEAAHTEAWSQAEEALALLPEAHPLRLQLHRDLAYIRLAHARHRTTPGGCSGGSSDFETCSTIFSATKKLASIAASAAATPVDHELLARAHDHAGDRALADAVRARAGGRLQLNEQTLGFLDFSAGTIVADPPAPAEAIRCNFDQATCEVDRQLALQFQSDIAALIGETRLMPLITDGIYLGHKLYGIRATDPLKQLGFKNGDLILTIDDQVPTPTDFLPMLTQLFVRGGGTLSFERKGATLKRTITVR